MLLACVLVLFAKWISEMLMGENSKEGRDCLIRTIIFDTIHQMLKYSLLVFFSSSFILTQIFFLLNISLVYAEIIALCVWSLFGF